MKDRKVKDELKIVEKFAVLKKKSEKQDRNYIQPLLASLPPMSLSHRGSSFFSYWFRH